MTTATVDSKQLTNEVTLDSVGSKMKVPMPDLVPTMSQSGSQNRNLKIQMAKKHKSMSSANNNVAVGLAVSEYEKTQLRFLAKVGDVGRQTRELETENKKILQ